MRTELVETQTQKDEGRRRFQDLFGVGPVLIGHLALPGILPRTGGFGKYCVTDCTCSAISRPPIRAISSSASSRPEETPPPVTRFRSTTKRGYPRATLTAGKDFRHGMKAQCVVAL